WLGISTISGTVAFYFDTETSTGNLFDAALLDFELASPGDFAPEVSGTENAERQISVTDIQSIAFHYRIHGENFVGPLCNVLNFEAFLKNDQKYSGPLVDFEAGDFDFGQPEDWEYIASLTSSNPVFNGTECEFDLVHSGWQIQFPIIFSGFHDIETIPSIITAAGPTCVTADFETDAEGNAILRGQVIDDEYASFGLNISAENNRGSHPDLAIIFDSDAPTGGDIDLGTPNEDFAGPGVGTGGEQGEPGENAVAQHSILIIAENDNDENNDGLVDIPDDEVRGGSIWFVFGEETSVDSLRIIDIEESGAEINLYDLGEVNFETIGIPNLGDNSAQTVGVNKDGIKKLEVVFSGSGALDDICFEPTPPSPPPCGECEGGVVMLELQYNGSEEADVKVIERKDDVIIFEGIVQPGEVFSFIGSKKENRLDNEIKIFLNEEEHVSIHTSCSEPINPGLIFGDFEIISVNSRVNGPVCPLEVENGEGPILQTPVDTQSDGDVVLNEILPNPEGLDNQEGLEGEWVELYNNEDFSVDAVDWYIEDASESGNRQTISGSNTHTGNTILGPQGSGNEWLVVFMPKAILNNTGDTVSLYNFLDELKDSHSFGASSNDDDDDSANTPGEGNDPARGTEEAANEGKSIARIPDGTGVWIDPIPTPGKPNKLEKDLESEEQEDEGESKEEGASSTPSTEQTVEEIVEEDPSPEEAEASEEPQEDPPLLPEARISEEQEEEEEAPEENSTSDEE
ncbi:lamin tail domain-containing protein, partial [Patescibacteria group bacterium]|nr:lamin tail domain-containing protein [Patescibacteria group bacterium]